MTVCTAPAVDDSYADHSITATFTTVTETEVCSIAHAQ